MGEDLDLSHTKFMLNFNNEQGFFEIGHLGSLLTFKTPFNAVEFIFKHPFSTLD